MSIEILNATLTEIAGLPVEITVRGDNDFTFSYDGENAEAAKRIAEFFGVDAKPDYDAECDMTCIYVTLAQAA